MSSTEKTLKPAETGPENSLCFNIVEWLIQRLLAQNPEMQPNPSAKKQNVTALHHAAILFKGLYSFLNSSNHRIIE